MLTGVDYYKSLPRKRMASEVFFINKKGEILLVKPTYKDRWGVPGGVVEKDESPKQAATREVKEELNLTIRKLKLIGVDYTLPYGPKDEAIMFDFFGGVLKENDIRKIKLPKEELSDFVFVAINKAVPMVTSLKTHTSLPKRLKRCLAKVDKTEVLYMEGGEIR
ncbi:NUDIX hydrolase [Patescibacteria group bacterium]|nr:NUDIX hydrolase [Patescibacteria group bacterium]